MLKVLVIIILLERIGVECLRGLVELDVRYNDIKTIEELVKISCLLHLRILALSGINIRSTISWGRLFESWIAIST